MTVAPGHARVPAGQAYGRLARWAVRVSAVGCVATAASLGAVGIAEAVDVEGAVEDTLLGWALASTAVIGFLATFAAYVAAIVSRIEHQSGALLWIPLSAFPTLLALLVLGEVFFWE